MTLTIVGALLIGQRISGVLSQNTPKSVFAIFLELMSLMVLGSEVAHIVNNRRASVDALSHAQCVLQRKDESFS